MTAPALRIAGVLTAYFLAGWFGLTVASNVSPSITLIWAPAGIAVAAVRLWGRSVLPGVFLGALSVNLITGAGLASLLIATGNTIEALVVVAVFTFFIPTRQRVDDVEWFAFLCVGAVIGCVVAASVGSSALLITDQIPQADFGSAWVTWLTGDFLGIMLIASFVLFLFPPNHPVHADAAAK